MLKKHYFKVLTVLLLFILILVILYSCTGKNAKYLDIEKNAHYYLNGMKRSGQSFLSGYAYRNDGELYIFLGHFSEPSVSKNEIYKYYRVDVYYEKNLIYSDERKNVDLYDYWNNFKMFKKVQFFSDDFKLSLKVYDKKEGKCLYEKEILVERFI